MVKKYCTMFQIQWVKHISYYSNGMKNSKVKEHFLSTIKSTHIFTVIFKNVCHVMYFTIYKGLPDLLNSVYNSRIYTLKLLHAKCGQICKISSIPTSEWFKYTSHELSCQF
jgi:hypothetical protein